MPIPEPETLDEECKIPKVLIPGAFCWFSIVIEQAINSGEIKNMDLTPLNNLLYCCDFKDPKTQFHFKMFLMGFKRGYSIGK